MAVGQLQLCSLMDRYRRQAGSYSECRSAGVLGQLWVGEIKGTLVPLGESTLCNWADNF